MANIKISQLPSATLPLSGSEVLPIVQSGETRKVANSAISPFGNVKAYGAVGDGVADDTVAIQTCVNANDGVFFPTGTYKVTSAVSLKTNNTLFGEGASSVILYTGTAASQGALYINSGGASTFVDNVTVQDLKVLGQVAALGFSEFVHNISFSGVRNCLIERCVIEGFRGDGIYIGSGDLAGQERHNINVTIRDCYIDGVNKDNRNGISVIDCDGMNIDNNYITRCTKNTMPGAIDIEPDSNAYHVVRDISIRNNKIYDLNNGVAAIGVFLPYVAYTTWPTGFNIENNYIDIPSATTNNAYGFFFQYGSPFTDPPAPVVTDSTPDFAIRIRNNFVKFPTGASPPGYGRGFVLWNCNDVVMDGNTFTGGSASLLGYPGTNVINFTLSNNEFISVNGAGDYAVSVFSASRLTIEGNIFKNCGGVSGAARGAIEFSVGNFILNPGFTSSADWTTGTGWSIGAGVATKTAGVSSALSQTRSPVVIAPNAAYQLAYTITVSAGTLTPRLTGGTTVTGTPRTASGTYIETITALSGNTTVEFLADATFAGTVDEVYLRSGSSSYVKINNNTFTSPGGSFTQQAVRDSGHTFTPSTNTFLNNVLIDGVNQLPALLQANNNGVSFNGAALDETYLQVRGTLKSNAGVSLPVLVDAEIGSSTTGTAALYRTAPTTQATSFTLGNLIHYQAVQGTKGAGSAITNQFGYVADASLVGGVNNYGFFHSIPAAANRYGFAGSGTAANFFNGTVGIGGDVDQAAAKVQIRGTLPTDSATTRGLLLNGTIPSGTTSNFRGISSAVSTEAASFTLATLHHFHASQGTLGAGSTVTDQAGFAVGTNLTGASSRNYGFLGQIAAGTGRFNFYASGTADNYMAGSLGLGAEPGASTKLQASGTYPVDSGLSRVFVGNGTIPSGATTAFRGFDSSPSTAAASFTCTDLQHFYASQGSLGAGSAVTNQYGFYVASGMTGATNNFAFYNAGTARSYFGGGVEVVSGTTTMTVGFTHIPAAAGAPTGAPTNPSGNVPLYYDSTNHKIYVYSGGTWRSTAALT